MYISQMRPQQQQEQTLKPTTHIQLQNREIKDKKEKRKKKKKKKKKKKEEKRTTRVSYVP